ncbi:nickel-dependent hydrogenase large subunit [Clostridium sp. PL3]|uniref:Nickel-dependent hydrogenase large subunit n=1 Tax=Clostridium thailandense TaxID=2794346 RepID=A0A949X2H1_9CLOT|nr:nickel-dependent hydrogenase large subunit [Clostridium thailandense]MBV7271368.1 nickel-dependent hydrogenase large subunit [Clostridium thailandense]
MSRIIKIDPVTRISGFLEIKVEVEQNTIVNAESSGLLYRGFEKMLKGRAPLDATYFTERICGICSTSHAMASSLALEDVLKLEVAINDSYIRDLIHGFEFLHNHMRQFYYFTVPSFVKMPDIKPLSPQGYDDFRIPEALSKKVIEDYIENVKYSRLAQEGLAVLAGKAPHGHGIFAGGVTVNIDSYKLVEIKSIISELKKFINNSMISDMDIIARYYPDYFQKGISYPNFMSYGIFDRYSDPEISYVGPSVMIAGKKYTLDPNKITESIKHAWYVSNEDVEIPGEGNAEEVDIKKAGAYTFIKAPRYGGMPMEVGPLARLMLVGEYTRGNSCMDRNVARVMETKKIVQIMENLTERIQLKRNNQKVYNIPDKALGIGLIDTIRGALGHWLQIENKVIKYYDIITPTMWNLSPKDNKGLHGALEKALIDSKINDINQPVEIGRIARSFDPCVSCATHIAGNNQESMRIEILV